MTGLTDVRKRIENAAREVGRDPADITLIAVSKVQPADRIEAVLNAGQRVFGENRVQEAKCRWPKLRERYHDVELHLIGPLQTNKIRQAVELFDVFGAVDRPKLARKLADAFSATGQGMPCYIQVNTGEEPRKAGIPPDNADAFITECRDTLGLPLAGLMCIPPVDEEPALHFALLKNIATRNGLTGLSMGMSHDFETAIRMGATVVRIGSALFGERQHE